MNPRFFIFFSILMFLNLPACAKVLNASVELDWPLLNQQARTKIISELRESLLQDLTYKIDKNRFSEYKKDSLCKENKIAIKKKFFELPDKKLAAFYLMGKVLVIYGVQYKTDKYHTYYYDAMGKLRYVDILTKPYDEFPHVGYQYDKKGKLKSVVYNISEQDQYVFKPNGKFYGRWYNSKLYDEKAKIIMTRKIAD